MLIVGWFAVNAREDGFVKLPLLVVAMVFAPRRGGRVGEVRRSGDTRRKRYGGGAERCRRYRCRSA